MIRFRSSRTSEDGTPVVRDIEVAKYAEQVLYDYRPELFDYSGPEIDPYLEPALLDPYDFAENYLGAAIDVQDIYTENEKDFIAGAAVFTTQKVKVFDKTNMCTKDIIVPPNTILLDNRTVHKCPDSFENFTIMHEAGHLLIHRPVYLDEPNGCPAMCIRSSIGRFRGRLETSEDFIEHQANTFAASMLMPPRLFIPYVQSIIDGCKYFDDEIMICWSVNDGTRQYWKYREIVRSTANRFGVSVRAAEVQMGKYGLHACPKDNEVKEARRRLKLYKSLWSWSS